MFNPHSREAIIDENLKQQSKMIDSWKSRIAARERLAEKEKEKKEKIFAAVRQ